MRTECRPTFCAIEFFCSFVVSTHIRAYGLYKSALETLCALYIFISPKHCSSSMKYSKHNIQQKKQTKKRGKNLQLPFRVEVSKFTLEFSYSFSPQIAWHVKSETFLTVFDVISITCFK